MLPNFSFPFAKSRNLTLAFLLQHVGDPVPNRSIDVPLEEIKRLNMVDLRPLLASGNFDDIMHTAQLELSPSESGRELRKNILKDIQDWAEDPNSTRIFWMSGMTGTGKTTIFYSLCKWLLMNQQLGWRLFLLAYFFMPRREHQ